VTNAQYARFLGALPEEERAGRAPSTGLELSRARVWRPSSGMGRLPVVGIRPADARAYCAWAGAEEGVTLRLPSEAEWLLASGAVCSTWGRGDLAVEPGDAYGLSRTPEALCEMASATEPAAGVVGKTVGAWYAVLPLSDEAPVDDACFRCVQVLPQPD
jgi:hypothetical protein